MADSLGYLAQGSQGEKALTYFRQSADAYQNALQIYSENDFPTLWMQTMEDLAQIYEAQGRPTDAARIYQDLLQHDPRNPRWQAKVEELTGNHGDRGQPK